MQAEPSALFGKGSGCGRKACARRQPCGRAGAYFRFFLCGFDVYGIIGGYDFVRAMSSITQDTSCAASRRRVAGASTVMSITRRHRFRARAGGAPGRREGCLASIVQRFGMFLAAPSSRSRPGGEPEAHNDDDARNEQRGDGVRHMQMPRKELSAGRYSLACTQSSRRARRRRRTRCP